MNLHHAATQITSSHERHDEDDTRLNVRWLLLGSGGWHVFRPLDVGNKSFSMAVAAYVCRRTALSLVLPGLHPLSRRAVCAALDTMAPRCLLYPLSSLCILHEPLYCPPLDCCTYNSAVL